MPFALDSNPSQSEISEALNYLLGNFGANLSADPNTGEIKGPTGNVIAYLYKYLAVKYADSADGALNFSNSPTGRLYFGLRNTNDTVESTNPADYIWKQVAGGFGTTKFLFYQTNGGRQISIVVDTVAPDSTYLQDTGTVIDLDVVTTTTAYNTAAPSIYIWTSTSTPPARPSTTSTYSWSTGTYLAPAGWTTSPITNTTPGSYLWAITIPLVVNANTLTSTLDWTNVAYPLYAFSYNGDDGPTGENGISAITAYRVQNQSAAAPSTPLNTYGPTAPAGWSLVAPSVSVGEVLWYSFGRYNSSSVSIDFVPPGETAWDAPTAASIFQDIRSDNWNGSNPPTFGIPSSYGTTGYYIQRTTGDVFFNNGIFRGSISTDGDAYFEGNNPTLVSVTVAGASYLIDYSSAGYAISNAAGKARVGHFGYATSSGSGINAGVVGIANTLSRSFGVVGESTGATGAGGFFSSSAATGYGLECTHTAGGTAFFCNGLMRINNTVLVDNLNAEYWNGFTSSDYARIFQTNSGIANAAGAGIELFGSTSTGIAGAYVGTSGSGNTVTFTVQTTSPSDVRLKEEIADVDLGLDFVNQLRPVSYKLKADPRHQKGYGFIADEVEDLIGLDSSLVYEEPNWQVGDEVGFKTIHYPSYIAVLTKAIQELTARVQELERKAT